MLFNAERNEQIDQTKLKSIYYLFWWFRDLSKDIKYDHLEPI